VPTGVLGFRARIDTHDEGFPHHWLSCLISTRQTINSFPSTVTSVDSDQFFAPALQRLSRNAEMRAILQRRGERLEQST